MADETSSIALQLNVQLRGLVNLTKLNAALVDLKRNARGIQQDLGKGTKTLGDVGKKAKEAADGLAKLTKANKDLNKAVGGGGAGKNINDHMAGVFKKLQQNTYDDAAKAAQRTNTHMAKQFSQLQKGMVSEAAKGAKQRAAQEQMYARMFDQIERKNEQVARRTASVKEGLRRRELAGMNQVWKQRQNIAKLEQSLTGRLRLAEEENDAIFRAGFRLQMLGNDMEALGRKTAGALASMANEFGEFEFMVNRAAGATGILKDEVDGGVNIYDRFTSSILDATQELRLFKPEEVAKATYFWASTTGQQVDTLEQLEGVMASINPLMKIAAMTQTDYETAIKGVYSILVQYGMVSSDVAKTTANVVDVTEKLHMVTQRTAAEFPDLVNSFKMVGPIAKEFGVTFDDMVVLLGRLADAGIRGTMSGRAFRQFFIQISRPAPKATTALTELWKASDKFGKKSYIDTVFPEGKFIGVNKYVNELAMRLQDATDKERMFTLATITTANELPVLTALVSKQISVLKGTSEGWDSSKENMQDAAKGFENAWSILRNSWKGTVGALTTGVEILRIKVGGKIAEIFGPVLEDVTKKLIQVRRWFEDEANGPVIEFFVKLATAAAVVLTIGGALTVLVGVLVAMTAASRVAFKAFSPLFGLFGKIGGTIGGFALAIVRNFDYIKKTIGEAGDIIAKAMGEGEGSVKTFTDAIGTFAGLFAPVFDVVIHILGELLLVGAKVTAWILKNEGAMNILGVAANVLGGIIAGRLVLSILKLNAALLISGGMKVYDGLNRLWGVFRKIAVDSSKTSVGIKGLATTLTGLSGKAGLVGIAIAAVAAAFLVLYANSETVRKAVDKFAFEFITSLEDVKKAAKEARDELGTFGDNVESTFAGDTIYQSYKKQISDLRAAIAKDEADGITFGMDARTLDRLEKEFAAYTESVYGTFKSHVEDLNNLGADVNLTDYLERAEYEAKLLGVDINNAFALGKTDMWFRSIKEGSDQANNKAAELLKTINGVTSAARPSRAGRSKAGGFDSQSVQLAKLIDLKAQGGLSGQFEQEVTNKINSMIASGVEAAGDSPEVDEASKTVMGEVSSSLLSASKVFLDFDKKLSEIMKEAIKPGRQVAAVFKSYISGWVSKGFKDSDGHFHVEAALFAQQSVADLRTQFQTYLSVLPPAESTAFVNSTIKRFKTDFKNGLPKSVTPEMAEQLFLFIQDVYTAAGKPIPQKYIDMFTERGSETATAYGSGVSSPASVAGATKAGETVKGAANTGLTPGTEPYTSGAMTTARYYEGLAVWKRAISTRATNIGNSTRNMDRSDDSYSWGSDLGSNFYSGLQAWVSSIIDTAKGIAQGIWDYLHQTTAEKGPLRDTDKWGLHLGQNIADGLSDSVSAVRASALNVANAATAAYTYAEDSIANGNVNVESSANRTIKVQVEVTSPDGSVDRLKAAELERGIMTNDLILSIEHMSTVG